MNVKTPHRLNGTLRSEYEGADLSLSEFGALECDWRVLYQRVMSRAEDLELFEMWSTHPLTVLVEISQSQATESKIEEWHSRLTTYTNKIAHTTPATEAAQSLIEELRIGTEGITRGFDYYLGEVERSGDMTGSLSMLLIFVRNYSDIAKAFNKRLESLPDIYRKKMLRLEPKGAKPDRNYVVVTPAEGEGAFKLSKKCEFKGEMEGMYHLNVDSYVSPINVVGAHTIFDNRGVVYTAPTCDGSRLFETENPNNSQAEYNWVIASDILRLGCGERQITIGKLEGENLRLFTSHEEGWVEREFTTKKSQFIITIPSTESALTHCSADTHEIETLYPALKIVSNRAEVTIQDVGIEVNVSGLSDFRLSSEIGEMDSSQPLYPFGVLGECGAWFSFGCEEMVGKPLSKVALSGVWSTVSGVLQKESLVASLSQRNGKRWQEIDTTPLFCSDSEEAEFAITLAGAKSEGYYQVKLQKPTVGFGYVDYQKQFAQTMMYNARHSKRKQRAMPQTPTIPMLSDIELSYSASCRLEDMNYELLRMCETREWEKIDKPSPLTTHNSLIIQIDNAQNQKRVRLFFDLKFYIKRRLVNCNIQINPPRWEWYSPQNGEWQPLGAECIITDDTYNFTRSGAIEFDISQIFGFQQLYLRSIWEGDAPRHISLNNIYVNCFGVTAIGGDGTSLKSGSINSLAQADSRVVAVTQPFDGYGGKEAESNEQSVRRATTRIATRGRAVTPLDYEHLILERFTEVDKVCCVPANARHPEVRIVLFPKPIARCLVELPVWKLRRVEEYMRDYISPFASVVAMRPSYEFITIHYIGILQKDVADSGEAQRRIRRRGFGFFASWYLKGVHPTLGKEYWHSSLLSRVSNDKAIFRTISLNVTGAVEERVEGESYYRGATMCSLLIPRHINIELVEYNMGVDSAAIDNNFIIE